MPKHGVGVESNVRTRLILGKLELVLPEAITEVIIRINVRYWCTK